MSDAQRRNVIFGSILLLFLLFLIVKVWKAGDGNPDPVNQTDEVTETTEDQRETIPSIPQVVDGTTGVNAEDVAETPDDATLDPAVRKIRSALKLYLVGIYSAEKAFYAESGRYSTDLDVIGWMPSDLELLGKAGFLSPYQPDPDQYPDQSVKFNTDQSVEESMGYEENESRFRYAPSAETVNLNSLGSYCDDGCTASADRFEVISAANLDNDEDLDIWKINDAKELTHVFDDLTNGPPASGTPPMIPQQTE